MNYTAQILVDSPSQLAREQLFDYSLPESLVSKVKVGTLVTVPFGRSLNRGLVISTHKATDEKTAFELKEVQDVLQESIFQSDYLELLLWVSEFYLCDLWSTLKGILPLGLFSSFQERIKLLETEQAHEQLSVTEKQIISLLDATKDKSLTITFLKSKVKDKNFQRTLKSMIDGGLVKKITVVKKAVQKPRSLQSDLVESKPIHLSENQAQVLAPIVSSVQQNERAEFLIHGVTGSGKTEVYFEAAREVLKMGKKVIYLVPEISLSVQMLERVKAGLISNSCLSEDQITLWHSNLSDGQRLQAWKDCLEEGPRIVLGARSAIFAPVLDLGLIIIDEEHDSSYKSGNRPFYDARTIAQKRATFSQAVLVSGSATPSVISYQRAKKENHLLELKHRFHGLELPQVEIVDMKLEMNDGNRSIFSRKLDRALRACIEKKEQAILLLNRRGHSNYVFCRDCGYVAFCDHCSVPMIYHATDDSLRCHHCNDVKPILKDCPACGSKKIKQTGLGTQRLELEVKKRFPQAEVIRLDRDVSASRNGMREVWQQLTHEKAADKCQILLGTQLVAKGIDLPRVTLVGVVHAEGGLYLPDYTAAERSFQLLTQAAGRAGRHDKPGRVIFQTYVPEQWVIELSAKQDYHSFYEQEIEERRKYAYPPFKDFCRLILSHEKAEIVEAETVKLKELIERDFPAVEFLGPAPCPIERLNKLFRWHLLLKFDEFAQLKAIYQTIQNSVKLRARLNFDVLPVSLL